jgi:hypothetical protein
MSDLIKVTKLQGKIVDLMIAWQRHSSVTGIVFDTSCYPPLLYELASIQAILAQRSSGSHRMTGAYLERYVFIFRRWRDDLRRFRYQQSAAPKSQRAIL